MPHKISEQGEITLDKSNSSDKFQQLITDLRQIISADKDLKPQDIDVAKVSKLMSEYSSNETSWSHFALHDESKNYSRNGIADINGNANLLILVWSPGKSSAIHDHANAHCIMKILKGQLKESLYEIPDHEGDQLIPKKETILETQSVGYISDDIGLHRISNASDTEYGVSLHLYTPPYASMYGCSMYEAENGKKHHVDMSKFYSWQGKLVNPKNSSTC